MTLELAAALCYDSRILGEHTKCWFLFTYLFILGARGGLHQLLDLSSAIDEIGQQPGENSLWESFLRILRECVIILKNVYEEALLCERLKY